MIGFHMHRQQVPARAHHHDPAPRAVTIRSPFPWFAVAIVAGFAAVVLS